MSAKCGRVCAMYGCYNYTNQKERKSFFRMPRDKERLKKWVVAIKRQDLDELLKVKEPEYFNRIYYVCSDHFDVQCFKNKNLYSQGLHPWSVPTLYIYNVVNVKKRKICDIVAISGITSKRKVKSIPEASEKVISDPAASEKVISDPAASEKVTSDPAASEKVISDPDEIKEVFISNIQESTVSISSLQEENSNLKFLLSQYKKKFKNKIALVSKYRRKIGLLKQKLIQYEKDKSSNNEINVSPVCNQFIEIQYKLAKTRNLKLKKNSHN